MSRPRIRSRASPTITPADPPIGVECAICLCPITLTTRTAMESCVHVYHLECIDVWHRTQRMNSHAPNCPICRTPGPPARDNWPTFPLYRSLCGPWGSVAITPDLLVVHARYWFSQPTKQLIRFSDIAQYFRHRNCIFLVDAVGAILTSFHVRRPEQLFDALATASVKHSLRNPPRVRRRGAHTV